MIYFYLFEILLINENRIFILKYFLKNQDFKILNIYRTCSCWPHKA